MIIDDILRTNAGITATDLNLLQTECSQFLHEAAGIPLLKALPSTYSDFQRVKVRRQKRVDEVTTVFNEAFKTQYNNLRQRAIFANSTTPELHEDQHAFYIFPVNGFGYLYSKEVTHSNTDYRRVMDTIFESFDDTSKASDIITDLLKYAYTSDKLAEGLAAKAEVIVYGVPYYYAIRTTAIPYLSVINARR